MWNSANRGTCDYCNENQLTGCKHHRTGKTKAEHENGTWTARFSNREQRVSWQKDPRADNKNFPYGSCNGKKNKKLK